MLLIAGVSLRNVVPRFWDPEDPLYVPGVGGVMVSAAEFRELPSHLRAAREEGFRKHLRIPDGHQLFLDNGAFHTLERHQEFDVRAYRELVRVIAPDWYPIPVEHVPHPSMTRFRQRKLYSVTMRYNRKYAGEGFVPVAHVGECLHAFLDCFERMEARIGVPRLGLGAMVPFLLRSRGADGRTKIVDDIVHVRQRLPRTRLHGFGIGGTATLHIAAVLGLDSVDSSGWRNRAARGIVQLRGTGDRVVADFGKWRGRRLAPHERASLQSCGCPSCSRSGPAGLERGGVQGFAARAAHNLWVLVRELADIEARLGDGTYLPWMQTHVDNRLRWLIQHAVGVNPKAPRLTA